MADMLRSFVKHMDGINKAAIADAAAKAMAEHCEDRIQKAKTKLAELEAICRECAAGSKFKPEVAAYRSMAAKIAAVQKRI